MSTLEIRHRRLLRVLPAGYREVREEEMVDAYVQQSVHADPEMADLTLRLGWPGLAESVSVLALAIRLRWADPQAPQRYRVRAAALRFVTLACLSVLAVTAAQTLLATVLFAAAPPEALSSESPTDLLVSAHPDVWTVLQQFSYALWIPVLVLATLGGRPRICWAATVEAVPVVGTAISMISRPASAPNGLSEVALLLVQVAVIVGLVAMATARGEAVGHGGDWRVLTVGAIGLGAWAVVLVVGRFWPASPLVTALSYMLLDSTGIWCAAAVMTVLFLLVRWARGTAASTSTLLGLAWLAVAAAVLRAVALPGWLPLLRQGGGESAPMLLAVVVQLGLTVTIAVGAGTLGIVRPRRLPEVSYRPVGPHIWA